MRSVQRMAACVLRVLALSTSFATAAVADPGPNVRIHDGGANLVIVTDRLRSAAVQFGLEVGHTARWGGFFEIGALWPRATPDTFASGGPLMGLGGSFALQFSDVAAFLTTTELAVSWVGCRGDRTTCAAVAGGKPSDAHLDLTSGQWITRFGFRAVVLQDWRGNGIELFVGPHWRQGLGGPPVVDLPEGLGLSFAVGVGFHNR